MDTKSTFKRIKGSCLQTTNIKAIKNEGKLKYRKMIRYTIPTIFWAISSGKSSLIPKRKVILVFLKVSNKHSTTDSSFRAVNVNLGSFSFFDFVLSFAFEVVVVEGAVEVDMIGAAVLGTSVVSGLLTPSGVSPPTDDPRSLLWWSGDWVSSFVVMGFAS